MATFLRTREPNYCDLDLTFTRNRVTNDVATLNGLEAIKQSIVNLVLTNYYEKPFRPSIGSNVLKLLFEPGSPLVVTFLQQAIADVINNFEPRATLLGVLVTPTQNQYDVQIAFSIRNVQEPQVISFFLERVR